MNSFVYDSPNPRQDGATGASSITIGIFMDGTCNNSYNVEAREVFE